MNWAKIWRAVIVVANIFLAVAITVASLLSAIFE